ncbi:hypothetical protein BWI97_14180 [Siphonobacter sp. BAB-5405]|uniref:hypothetical protein n=1 Tax=Siphonobacter sp. BAB-5405 TaxID=1864825 RepID=UPI000C80452D|nr:hypothetical protein [Siphonobacter sp. BAB-5405]PMD95499.1 hypothetical protein BWI97_14180 [Siphonobacter sp. BAB-5405]
MKYILFCFLITFFYCQQSYAQQSITVPCHEVEQVNLATDSIKFKILSRFIDKCIYEKRFSAIYDKGIVHLIQFTNSEGKLCWHLIPRIDDSYKNNPPSQFMDFLGDIILVFQGNQSGSRVQSTKNKEALNGCLEKIIGDRVFTSPTIKSRWTSDVLPIINKQRSEGNRRNLLGNAGEIIIVFNPDGTYQTIIPA